jgi:branched-chain amino acid transport system permease protein
MSVMKIMQFAHGEVYMLGGFIVYFLSVQQELNVFLAMLISMIAVGALGLVMERVILRPLGNNFLRVVCATIGLMLILQTGVTLTFGANEKHLPNFWPGVFSIQGWIIPKDRFGAVLVCIVLVFLLFLLLKRSKYGQAIIASAQNRTGALLQGVNPNLMSAMVMTIGSAMAAVGGALAGGIFVLDPFMGTLALTKGILIIILGGMGSLLGVIVGGIFLGLVDSLVPLLFGSAPAVIAPLVIIILILLFKPQGLFGHE